MGTSQIYTKIIRHKLTQKTLAAQRTAMIHGLRYVLELQQLEINLRNESWIPKELIFTAFKQIDVKQETIRIREKIKLERQAILEEDRKYEFL